jgi:hypothetical protein
MSHQVSTWGTQQAPYLHARLVPAFTLGHFSARIYCLAVLGDIVLRCTWVITLMPITVLGKVGVTVGRCWMVGRQGLFQGLCF